MLNHFITTFNSKIWNRKEGGESIQPTQPTTIWKSPQWQPQTVARREDKCHTPDKIVFLISDTEYSHVQKLYSSSKYGITLHKIAGAIGTGANI